jgi:HEPN domain-containing protein
MRDLRQARAILAMANKDLRALKAMVDAEAFDDEIFGFHAQQAIEKSLKAWAAILGREYPLTHDISALLDLLESSGQDVERYWDLVEYNVFAVRFRYESLEVPDEPLDRAASVRAIEALMRYVETLLAGTATE